MCEEIGILTKGHKLSKEISFESLAHHIQTLNKDDTIDGILVQLPLPDHLKVSSITELIDPKKDVDGFHFINYVCTCLRLNGGLEMRWKAGFQNWKRRSGNHDSTASNDNTAIL